MNWRDHKVLAIALRDQSLADCVAARFALRPFAWPVLGEQTTLSHIVVAKCQQSVEKLVKGFLLWQSASFDPAKGHAPFTETLDLPEGHRETIRELCFDLNRRDRNVVRELQWLESLAPYRPQAALGQEGMPQSLNIIPMNSEYPFWCPARKDWSRRPWVFPWKCPCVPSRPCEHFSGPCRNRTRGHSREESLTLLMTIGFQRPCQFGQKMAERLQIHHSLVSGM